MLERKLSITLLLLAMLMFLAVFAATPAMAECTEALVWTDKEDYSSGETVVIYGSGFIPDASVSITVTRPDGSIDEWAVTSDSFGSFTITYLLDGITGTYTVIATDGTNTATTTFTDADIDYVSVSPNTRTITAGDSTTYTVTVAKKGGSTLSVTLSIVGSLPSGASVSFSVNPVQFSSSESGAKASTLTITTSSSGSTGTFTFKVRGTKTGTTNTADSSEVTLIVNPATANVVFAQVGVGSDFTGTVLTIDGTINLGVGDFDGTKNVFTWTIGSSHTFAYQSPLAVGSDKRYVWTSTTSTGGLPTSQSGTIIVPSGGGTVTGNYKTQFKLTLATDPSAVGVSHISASPSSSDWFYDVNTVVSLTADSPVAIDSISRYRFDHWSGDASGSSNPTSVTMGSAKSVTANYKTQFYITVTSAYDSPTLSDWVDEGSDFTAEVTSPVGDASHQWVCTGHSVDGGSEESGVSHTFTAIAAAHEIVFNWQEQCYLTVNTSPLGLDSPTGEGWYDTGVTAHVSTAQYVDIVPGSSRYRFDSWTGASGTYADATVVMDSAKTATANYQLQYYLTLAKNPSDVAIAPSGAGWYDENAYASISTAQYVDIVHGSSRYRFDGWTTADMVEITNPSATSTTVKMDKAKTVIVNYVTQYKQTFTSSGLGPDATGTLVSGEVTDGKSVGPWTIDVPEDFIWVDEGATVIYTYANPVTSSLPDTQYWLYDVTGPTSPYTVEAANMIMGYYKKLPFSQVTTSKLCYFDVDGDSSTGQQFRLIFTQDPASPNTYKLTASNPGQFYYNVFYIGTPGTPVTLIITIPYPFVTQGAVPIHVYSGVDIVDGCFVPSGELSSFTINSMTISLADPPADAMITISGAVPYSGLVYVTIHLDYGFKGTVGYTNNGNNDAVSQSSGTIIPNLGSCAFSYAVGSPPVDRQPIENENVFKRDPGFAGIVTDSSGNPISGVEVQIYSPTGSLLATVYTDEDGFYSYHYKHTGKAATFTIELPDYGTQQSVTLKANSFVVVNFQI